MVKSLPRDQQAKVMGASNFRLWDSGKVAWDRIVTPSRIRPLHQVVALEKLSVKAMTDLGISRSIAEAAHAAVHTPEHLAVAAHRKELLQKIAGAGVAHEQVVKHLAEKVASRAVIAPGQTYTTKTETPAGPPGTVLPGIPARRLINPVELRQRHADELKAILGSGEKINRAIAALKKAPAPKPAAISPSKAKLVYADEGWSKAAHKILGRPITEQQILSLTGAPEGNAAVTFHGDDLLISVQSDRFRMTRLLKVGHDGKPAIQALSFYVEPEYQGRGLGADAFGRMVDQARQLGVAKIQTHAARGPQENGYLTWPKFGYNAELDLLRYQRKQMPPSIQDAEKISDLLATEEGTQWWTENGRAMDMIFDLTPGSQSLQVWEAYLKAKAQQKPSK